MEIYIYCFTLGVGAGLMFYTIFSLTGYALRKCLSFFRDIN